MLYELFATAMTLEETGESTTKETWFGGTEPKDLSKRKVILEKAWN